MSTTETQVFNTKGIAFDGGDGFLSIDNLSRIDPRDTGAMTIEGWVYVSELPAKQDGADTDLARSEILALGQPGGDEKYWTLRSDSAIELGIGDGPSSAPSIDVDRWTHIATVYEDNTLTVYVDGSPFDEPFETSAAASGNKRRRDTSLVLGGKRGVAETFKGRVAEVRVWKTARSQEDIQRNMLRELPADDPDQAHVLVARVSDIAGGNYVDPNDVVTVHGTPREVDASIAIFPSWGVALTFDMHPKTERYEGWRAPIFGAPGCNKSLLDTLDDYGVKATFMVSGFDYVAVHWEWFLLIAEIFDRGHEIGMHTKDHLVYNASMNVDWYTRTQVFCNYKSYNEIRTSRPQARNWPSRPRSFAFPNTFSNWAIDQKLLHYFGHLRGSHGRFGPIPASALSVTGTIGGGWIDRVSIEVPGSWWNIHTAKSWIDQAQRHGQVATYGIHRPTADPNARQYTDPKTLVELLEHVVRKPMPARNRPFLRMQDLPTRYGWVPLEARCT